MPKKSSSVRLQDSRFLKRVLDLGKRGDISEIANSLNSYFTDKKNHPWHRIHSILRKALAKNGIPKTLLIIRDSFLGALDMLSLSLALKIPSEELIKIYTKQKSWEIGRKQVRSYCSTFISKSIDKKDIYHLDTKALERDGFSYLVPDLLEAQVEVLREGRPEVKKNKEGIEVVNFKKLMRSKSGRSLMRELGITESELPTTDSRASAILEVFDSRLSEMEIEDWHLGRVSVPTEQITLNGKVAEELELTEVRDILPSDERGIQTPLTEFLKDDTRSKKKSRKRADKKGTTKSKGKRRGKG